jgi:hypothetical protein
MTVQRLAPDDILRPGDVGHWADGPYFVRAGEWGNQAGVRRAYDRPSHRGLRILGLGEVIVFGDRVCPVPRRAHERCVWVDVAHPTDPNADPDAPRLCGLVVYYAAQVMGAHDGLLVLRRVALRAPAGAGAYGPHEGTHSVVSEVIGIGASAPPPPPVEADNLWDLVDSMAADAPDARSRAGADPHGIG